MRFTVVAVSVLLAGMAVAQQATSPRRFVIRSLSLRGNTVLTDSDKQHLRREVITSATINDINDLRQEIYGRVLAEYQDRGYFKTIVHEPEIRLVRTLPHQEIVDVLMEVEQSRRYRLSNIRFKGVTAFSSESVRSCFLINAGDVFERRRIADGLERLRHMYGRVGYIYATSIPETQTDERHGFISLLIDVDEGKPFHWGALTVRGDTAIPGAKHKLLAAWERHEGTIYDFDHALRLLLRELGARQSVRPGDIFSVSFDEQSGAANIEITLAQAPEL